MTTEPTEGPSNAALGGVLSEKEHVEDPAVYLLGTLGWQTADLLHESFGPAGSEGRLSRLQAFLPKRLRVAVETLNPKVPPEGLDQALVELTRDRSSMLPVEANREVYRLLKDGVPVKLRDAKGETVAEHVEFIRWNDAGANDFLMARQVWFKGDLYTRRCDLVGFVNGIPLVLFELKAAHKNAKDAYDGNLTDYLAAVPQIFTPNGITVLSNGAETRLGSAFAEWEHFFEWKRIEEDGPPLATSLEALIHGLLRPERLLDYVENFIVYQLARGGLVKMAAKNHQYLGVNRAIQAVEEIEANRGRLGVFWHTQGSGKSLSMVYFAQKVLRRLPGDWTFLIVTDRQELDDQIAKTFTTTGALAKELPLVQAQSREHLKELLTGNERYIFTLIQKFGTAQGETYPKLSDRSDIIVITDEAHRSQYDILAMNMRRALPNAAFIGFTGTPLMAGEEKTREVFGDYVSIYNFAQSIADGATVPLYYENRIPELQLSRDDLKEELERILDEAELDDEQEKRLQREFGRTYHLITRDDRLERIAEDIVRHFTGRGYRGKAMVICIDKATAVRMYDKVQAYWKRHLAAEEARIGALPAEEREGPQVGLDWLKQTDMAVVVSQSQNELKEMAEKGLDIKPHRLRMVKEDLDEKFKNPDDPFRLVFVCAMWITGFDVPTCSTIYLDKPMKNHTLMQTIARANRVAPGKEAGLIVDYVGVFQELEKALAIYAKDSGGESPIKDKAALVVQLANAVEAGLAFCADRGVTVAPILQAQGLARVAAIKEAAEQLTGTDEEKRRFLTLTNDSWRLYKAVLPDPRAGSYSAAAVVLQVLAERIRALTQKPDITAVRKEIETLLDDAITGVKITAPILRDDELEKLFDLSKIDFEKLGALLQGGRTKSKAEALRTGVERKIKELVKRNPLRIEFLDRFQKMIDAYNAGSVSAEELLQKLLEFMQSLDDEEKRALREGLTEEELAIFDLLSKPEPKLSQPEEIAVKKVAKELLEKLKKERLVLDWREKEQGRSAVRQAIAVELDRLPGAFTKDIYDQKCELTYQFVFEHYPGPPGGVGEGANTLR